ncbi:hypothetical protein ACLB1S_21275 [Escherichia coli]
MNRSVSIEWQKQNVEDLIAVGRFALKQGNSGVMCLASGKEISGRVIANWSRTRLTV